jgi:hypothetical protein
MMPSVSLKGGLRSMILLYYLKFPKEKIKQFYTIKTLPLPGGAN